MIRKTRISPIIKRDIFRSTTLSVRTFLSLLIRTPIIETLGLTNLILL